jgi:16S rRNA (uracil1498-N3)-methyltransferase
VNTALRRSAAHVFVESLDAPVLAPDDLHHLVKVLRLREGEVVSVSDGAGGWRLCRLVAAGELAIDGEKSFEPAPSPPVTIGFAIPKGERPEWIVQKLTEIGVDRVLLLHAAHSVVRWAPDRAARNLERLRRVAREAAMQCRRVRLVELVGPLAVDAPLVAGDGVAVAEPGGHRINLSRPTVLIGPEGGWAPGELEHGGATVSLGSTILRVETAALVAATLLVDLREQADTAGSATNASPDNRL